MRGRRAVVAAGSGAAVVLTLHTAVNVRLLRRPAARPGPVPEPVSVLIPARDEADRIAHCLAHVLAQQHVDHLEVVVLDDQSEDGTAEIARAAAAGDPRVTVLRGTAPPRGWLGKPHACRQLADRATGSVLVFVDADVTLAPHAVAATVDQLRATRLDVVCPYPRQVAVTVPERLVQPLLQWSWLTTVPLRIAERTRRPSLGVANGQLLAVDAAVYRRVRGHEAVRADVLDDLALLRAVKAAGGRGTVTDGTALATCRMYTGWAQLRDGYGKSLWSAFGSPWRAAAVAAGLLATYVVPAAAAATGSRVGLLGYAAGVAGRVLAGRRTGARVWPEAAAHPVSVLVLVYLTTRSCWGRRRGTLHWKGRSLSPSAPTLSAPRPSAPTLSASAT